MPRSPIAFVPARPVTLLAGLLVLWAAPHGPEGQEDVPEALQRLEFLEGSWRAERVEFLNRDGDVVRVSSAEAHNELSLDGRVLVHRGRLHEPEIATRGWYWWSLRDERLHLGSVSSSGRYDEFVGGRAARPNS